MNTKVETYNLEAHNGKHIRKATRVVFEDGIVVKFIDKLSNKEAIRQALKQRQPRVKTD
jgi:hypothetical protein